jgi:putative ATP/GTP binding protein (partial match)
MWPGVGRGRVWLDEKTSRTCWTRRRTSRGIAGEFDDVKGAEHPATLSSRSSLAYTYLCADQVAEAIDVCERMLPECQRVLGSEHPFAKQVKNILEMARREMKQSAASSE